MDLREVGYDDRDWINLAQDRDRWWAYVRAAMNLGFLKSHIAETWTLRRTEEKRIETFEMWIWRRMERVKWTDRIRNEVVLERVAALHIPNDVAWFKINSHQKGYYRVNYDEENWGKIIDVLKTEPTHYLQHRTVSSQFTARLSWLVLLAQSLTFTESRTTDLQRRSPELQTQVPQLRTTALEFRASGSTVTDTTQVALWSRSWLHCYTRLAY
ncbi:hypothetical protein ANN_14191 [Periplaneta americana]|uniref:Uncharacterized protein n=1 Tax=Periplaneta americana TaxID=6978 RepID=A0ABQ8SVN9_PERAM|nr:hypothetical protein ANN_14191 [Periplaneta americana]